MASSVSSARFIGRADELHTFGEWLARAEGGAPVAIVVGGEAGVGKTRLIREAATMARSRGAQVLVGTCIDWTEAPIPYAPVVAALRGLVHDIGVEATTELLGPVGPELARLVPELLDRAHDAGRDTADEAPVELSRERLFDTVLSALERLASVAPVVLVIEDVHWSDHSTLDLVAFVVENLSSACAVVLTYRTDELAPGHPVRLLVAQLSRGRRATVVDLRRFNRDEMVDQLTAIEGTPPSPELAEMVWRRSEGNALFAEELLAAGASGTGRGLPPVLAEILMARLQRLTTTTQNVVRTLAAGGGHVRHELLAAATDVDIDERMLTSALREAVSSQLVVTEPGHDGYGFRHGLIREAAYSELLPGERTAVHTRYAEALTSHPHLSGFGGNRAAELAGHWHAAGRAAPALAASLEAARAAQAIGGFAEAHAHLERCLSLWDDVRDQGAELGIDLVTVLTWAAEVADLAGQHRRAAELVTDALARVDVTAEPTGASLLHERLGHYLWSSGDGEPALRAYSDAVQLAPSTPSAELARVLAAEARALMQRSRYRDARARAQEAVAIAREVGARVEEGRALTTLGFVTAVLDDAETGLAQLRQAIRIGDECDDPASVGMAYKQLALVLSGPLNRLQEAHDVALEGLHEASAHGLDSAYGVSLQAIAADTLFRSGRWDEADGLLAAALDRRPGGVAAIDLYLARAKLAMGRGRFADARDDLDTASVLAARATDPQFRVPLLTLTAGLALWEGRVDDAWIAVADGLTAMAGADDAFLLGPLLWHGLRAVADEAVGRPSRRGSHGHETSERVEQLLAPALVMRDQADDQVGGLAPLVHAYACMCEAEATRAAGEADPTPWAQAVDRWDQLGQPYPAAYARWRQAEALLAQGDRSAVPTGLVHGAHAAARAAGAEALRREIAALAKRARIDLPDPGPAATVAEPVDDGSAEVDEAVAALGLTPRERQVLSLVVGGHTNREIGEALFISEKTASVHVSSILAKLGARSRVEAAGIGHRLGIRSPD